MTALLLGLAVFLGIHSVRLLAPAWREGTLARWGELRWKGFVSLVSLGGFVLLLWGFGQARGESTMLWNPPPGMRHATAALVLAAFLLTVAAYLPGTWMRARLRSPMTVGVALWSAGHLLSNGRLPDVVLFGAFLAWSLAVLLVRGAPAVAASAARPSALRDLAAVIVGLVAFAAFAHWGHAALIGVDPFAAP